MNAHDNGCCYAFPTSASSEALGLTKRELFAALMMQGLVANGSVPEAKNRVAAVAVQYADALLKELEGSK